MISRFIFIVLCALLGPAAVISAQSAATLQRYSLEVKDFAKLSVIDGINVDYRCNPDSAGWAVFDAPADMASQIMFDCKNGTLKIMLPAREMKVDNLPTVTVYSRYLREVENCGDSLVRVLSVSPGPVFKVSLVGNGRVSVRNLDVNEATAALTTGNGQIVVSGRCQKANLRLAGTGSIAADELMAEDVNCRLAGTGTIGCAPQKELSVSGLGGTVYYTGSPEIKKRMAAGIHIEPLKAD